MDSLALSNHFSAWEIRRRAFKLHRRRCFRGLRKVRTPIQGRWEGTPPEIQVLLVLREHQMPRLCDGEAVQSPSLWRWRQRSRPDRHGTESNLVRGQPSAKVFHSRRRFSRAERNGGLPQTGLYIPGAHGVEEDERNPERSQHGDKAVLQATRDSNQYSS